MTGADESQELTARRWLLAFVALTVFSAAASNGAYHDDDLKHYLFARWVRYDASYLAHVWGRPGFTLLYALPAQAGWWACRLLSVGLSAVTAWATFRAAQRLGLARAAAAVPLVYAQPLFLHLAFTTLTETPTAAYLALATWARLAGRTTIAAALFSLTLITRHEAIVLLPVWAWALWQARARWPAWALLLWAPAAYNAATWLACGYLPGDIFARPGETTQYGQGTPLTFFVRFVVMAGPVVTGLAVVGATRLWRMRQARPLIAGLALYIAAQTSLYMMQAYASGGYARFLVPLAPWVAIAALAGLNSVRVPFPRAPSALCATAVPTVDARSDTADTAAARRLWLAVVAGFWVLAELEQAFNPIHAIAPYFWAFRFASVLFVAGVACGLWQGARPVCLAVVVLALVGPTARAAWPHRLRPRERVIAESVERLRANGLADRPLHSTSDWTYYFADRWYPARQPLYAQLGTAAPGSLFVWERRYAPSPDFNLQLKDVHADPRWREILRSPPDASGESFVHVFERLPTIPSSFPSRPVNASFPPAGRRLE